MLQILAFLAACGAPEPPEAIPPRAPEPVEEPQIDWASLPEAYRPAAAEALAAEARTACGVEVRVHCEELPCILVGFAEGVEKPAPYCDAAPAPPVSEWDHSGPYGYIDGLRFYALVLVPPSEGPYIEESGLLRRRVTGHTTAWNKEKMAERR
ncbi:MAG: hypothetical protein H6737_16645 [Alphaproteobacteria bacterium]|nr:hypothetical protein [Alphaproteobacteria bacterium]